VWWDGECDRLNDAKLVAFREFRRNVTSYNYENYFISERVLVLACITMMQITGNNKRGAKNTLTRTKDRRLFKKKARQLDEEASVAQEIGVFRTLHPKPI
jgi:hypothetical protein